MPIVRLGCNERAHEHVRARGFLSEVLVPKNSLRCPSVFPLPHGLRVPQRGHSYNDIISTVSGLDRELNRLKHLFSVKYQMGSPAYCCDIKSNQIPTNELNHIGVAAKALLELILSLKRELTVQIKVESSSSFDRAQYTDELVQSLENKVVHLLEKLNEVKSENASKLCCEGFAENTALRNSSPPGKETNQLKKGEVESCKQKHCSDINEFNCFSNNIRPSLLSSSFSMHYRPFQQHKKRLRNFFKSTKETNKYGLSKHEEVRTTLSEFDLNRCKLLQCKTNKECKENGHDSLQQHKLKHLSNCFKHHQKYIQNYVHHQMKELAQNSFKTSSLADQISFGIKHPKNNHKFERKRAGRDNSEVYLLPYSKQGMFGNKARYYSEADINNTFKYRNEQVKQNFQPNPSRKIWFKKVSFQSTSSDEAVDTDDDSDPSMLTDSDRSTSTIEVKKIHLSRRRFKSPENYFIDTNKKQKKKIYQQHFNKNGRNNFISSKNTLVFPSQENISVTEKNRCKSSNLSNKVKPYPTKSIIKKNDFSQFGIDDLPTYFDKINTYPNLIEIKGTDQKVTTKKKYNKNKLYSYNSLGYSRRRSHPGQSKSKRKTSKRNSKNKSNAGKKSYRSKSKEKDNTSYEAKNSKFPFRIKKSKRGPKNELNVIYDNNDSKYSFMSKYNPGVKIIKYDEYYDADDISSVISKPKGVRVNRRIKPLKNDSQLSDCQGCSTCSSNRYNAQERRSLGNASYFEDLDDSYSLNNNCDQYFERIPSNDFVDDGDQCEAGLGTLQVGPQLCDVCPPVECDPTSCDDEYDIIFEKVNTPRKYCRSKKVKCKRPVVLIEEDESLTDDSTSSPSSKCSACTDSTSSSLQECQVAEPTRKFSRKKHVKSVTVVKTFTPPSEDKEIVYRKKHKRRRKYIRVGSQKFQEVDKKEIEYDLNHPAKEKNTRGTSTEILPSHAKRTSTSDLIKLIKVIGTNTEQVHTRETGIDPIPQKQKTVVKTTVISKLTNTDPINIRSTGTETLPEKPKPLLVSKANDPLFIVAQKDQETNTKLEKKKNYIDSGTDPRPIIKIQQAHKSIGTLHVNNEAKFTNTDAVLTGNKETETLPRPENISIGLSTTPVNIQHQETSYEKVKTFSRGNDPMAIKMSNKQFQTEISEQKPIVKSKYTEALLPPHYGKITQTSFIEKIVTKPSVYQVQTQTDKVEKKTPFSILRQPKESQSISEEIALIDLDLQSTAEVHSSPSELSMHLTFEKRHEDVYKRRPKVCKPRCSPICANDQRVLVCERKRSKTIKLNSAPDCTIENTIRNGNSLKSGFSKKKNYSRTASDHGVNKSSSSFSEGRRRTPKLSQQCQMNVEKSTTGKRNKSQTNVHKGLDKSKSNIVLGSSDTTVFSCDWKNIAEQVKANCIYTEI